VRAAFYDGLKSIVGLAALSLPLSEEEDSGGVGRKGGESGGEEENLGAGLICETHIRVPNLFTTCGIHVACLSKD
jgi:hypothetical protein